MKRANFPQTLKKMKSANHPFGWETRQCLDELNNHNLSRTVEVEADYGRSSDKWVLGK